MAVVTTNARDFLELADVELHPGLILLRQSGLTRDEQWRYIEPAVRFVLFQTDPDYLVNKILEVLEPERFRIVNLTEL